MPSRHRKGKSGRVPRSSRLTALLSSSTAFSLLLLAASTRVAPTSAQYNAFSGQIPLSYIVELDPQLTSLDVFRNLAAAAARAKASASSSSSSAETGGSTESGAAASQSSPWATAQGVADGVASPGTAAAAGTTQLNASSIINRPIPVPYGSMNGSWSPGAIAGISSTGTGMDQDLGSSSAQQAASDGDASPPKTTINGGPAAGFNLDNSTGFPVGAVDPSSMQNSATADPLEPVQQIASRAWWREMFGIAQQPEDDAGHRGFSARDDTQSTHQQQTSAMPFSIRQEFPNQDLFFGLSLSLDRAQDVATLSRMQGVKSVTPISFVPRPRPYGSKIQVASKPSVRQLSDSYSSLSATGVDKVHAEGIDGSGIRIAVIDTGVDYTHPALGGCFGPGCKVAFGYDLVGDGYDGSNTPQSDADPLSQCGPHGTHVTGIIGAQDKRYKLVGVAPGASLGMYRIFGCAGGTADDVLMKAMEQAYEDGADILSISVGAPAGWSDSPTAKIASQIAKSGRVISVAAGNDAYAGMFFPSAPAVGTDVISVGSVDNAYYTVYNATISGSRKGQVPYFATRPLLLPSLTLYATTFDTTVQDDACSALPDFTPDLSSAVVLVRRGGCSLDQKFKNIVAYGGKSVLVYNTNIAPIYIDPTNGVQKAAMVSADDGEWLVGQVQQGLSIKLAFPDSPILTVANTFTGGVASSFTSYGPTFDMAKQTDLSAPGASILGLWPVPLGNYSILSGTSMAAPYVAGAAALLLQASKQNKTNLSETILDRFRSTAMPVFNSTNSSRGVIDTVARQGAGLLQMTNAIHYNTHVVPSLFSLNDSSATNHVRQFTITNNADIPLTYQITHEPAGTALTFPKNSIYPYPGPVPLVDVHASVSISPMLLSVNPGSNQTVIVTISPPPSQAAADSTSFPVFSGYLKVVSTPLNESLTVTYLGLASELSSLKMLDNGNGATKSYNLPAVIIGSTGKIQRLPRTYTFQDDDVPVLEFRLIAGSRYTVVELVEAATQEATDGLPDPLADGPADPGSSVAALTNMPQTRDTMVHLDKSYPDGLLPPIALTSRAVKSFMDRGTISTTHDSVKPANVVGTVASSKFLPRNSMDAQYGVYALAWDGTVEGAGKVRNGDYQLRLRTLKLGFDAPKENSGGSSSGIANSDSATPWEVWTSPIIRKA